MLAGDAVRLGHGDGTFGAPLPFAAGLDLAFVTVADVNGDNKPDLVVAGRSPGGVWLLSGNGDLIEPDDGIVAIGSGGPYALAAAKALAGNTDLDARTIAEKSMAIAAEICIYTNSNIFVEEL